MPRGAIHLGCALGAPYLHTRAQAEVAAALAAGDVERRLCALALAWQLEDLARTVTNLRTAEGQVLPETVVAIAGREYLFDADHARAAIIIDREAAERLVGQLGVLQAQLSAAPAEA